MDSLSPLRRSENMRRIRSKDTSPEMAIRRLVHSLGFRYRLHVGHLPGKPDLVFPGLKKIIDVRGCFWHQHRGCLDAHVPRSRTDYWLPKLRRNKQRDKRNQRKLRAQGWDVLILWECESKSEKVLRRQLLRFLGHPAGAASP
jgi:DNA mismatch endonuclease, patch repair protein